jgi:hypothetical protein
MKAKLLVLILGAAMAASSTAALAGPGRADGHGRPHAEQGHQRHADAHRFAHDRDRAKPDRHARGRHGMPTWAQGHQHGQRWSKHRPHRHYAWRAAPRSRYYSHHGYRGGARHYPGHRPSNSVSIILHGHF